MAVSIEFFVNPGELPSLPADGSTRVVLQRDSWDDYGFGTTFHVSVARHGVWTEAGVTKIARRGMEFDGAFGRTYYTVLDSEFEALGPEFFSVGQDAELYSSLSNWLGLSTAIEVFQGLRDAAAVPGLLEDMLDEVVALRSLFRTVSIRTVRDQYARILDGSAEKERFTLRYEMRPGDWDSPEMAFTVDPTWTLPSNVHVIIGANGTGKTTTLQNIRWALDSSDPARHDPSFLDLSDSEKITSLVSVSFSAFDVVREGARDARAQARFRVSSVSLPWVLGADDLQVIAADRPADETLAEEVELGAAIDAEVLPASPTLTLEEQQQSHYLDLIGDCLKNREERLLTALGYLADADIVLDDHGIRDAASLMKIEFPALSSGHKIVLLTVASLVRYCEEKTLVLVDEPESHLHAPLLGAFTRALSWLMTETNGLAIVATHSAVVLQEVPRRCAWKLWGVGGDSDVEKPSIETFGENLGVLTREVFGLELAKSGYHALLRDVAKQHDTYESAVAALDHEIGDEAKLLLRSLIYARVGSES